MEVNPFSHTDVSSLLDLLCVQ